ncbi:MAG: hypothetical protein NC120_06820 [Ruminococcus sp.]|nr:hypothetical protein [Ruminococcus sp.]
MNGVIFIKEVTNLSVFGSYLIGAILIAATVMSFGGVKLHIDGYRDFSDFKKIVGVILSVVGVALMVSLWAVINSDDFMSYADSLGLTESTGKYEVTVTAEADMNEFQERYEIINFENGVYTIKLK